MSGGAFRYASAPIFDAAIEALPQFAPYKLEVWYSEYNGTPKTTLFASPDATHTLRDGDDSLIFAAKRH
ncbi:hypothetical protein [Cupriavidus basilensis]|uniref:hypothetical protein n=1 Tax=Cupriavidus basilensis TaxID=68895 RepID=UPI0020A64B98|nr:hypothetical protein [Cupriavidus basilensis]MCP3024830.1 hypothetical protein [Cupriavidus basilensis]MDR3383113.1 hypothetical protein [Cupriavidus basilensis]